ncbi:MAG: His/Gly/Thr/Pro-type tRNA ligase C-terminal domain-containing protein, partial [bacterium]|nr:His/Gly/Thr/Pro-type tRNA ligase C-terminal domain-containing protein [bacterium]
ARGLSYYTGAIFEVKPTTVKIGSITAGGRYDDLTGVFGMPDISGIGISFGLDRIYDVLEELKLFPESLLASTQLMLASFDKDGLAYAVGLANRFRASGIKTEVYPDAAKMQKQFKYADKLNIPYVIVVGPEEMETELFTLKNMTNGEQTTLGIDEIIQNINR